MADHWTQQDAPVQVLPPGAAPVDDAASTLTGILSERAARFAEFRFGTSEGIDLRSGRRGLLEDEAASFLRAMDAGLLAVDDRGGVEIPGCRQKPGGGRYQLFSANRYGGDLYVSLNTEYLIQFGAACELVAFHGWPGASIEVEVGEFDALGHSGDRVVLAMEAKARIGGPDSLTGLWQSFVTYAASDEPPAPLDNHSRKYVELLRLTERGPVALWLVAAQARWPVLASRVGARVEFEPLSTVERSVVLEATATASVIAPAPDAMMLRPSIDHALAVARLTESDGQQRCYEFPWSDEHQFDLFVTELRSQLARAGLVHARPWRWRAASGGGPMSPSGSTSGLELRFSYYAR